MTSDQCLAGRHLHCHQDKCSCNLCHKPTQSLALCRACGVEPVRQRRVRQSVPRIRKTTRAYKPYVKITTEMLAFVVQERASGRSMESIASEVGASSVGIYKRLAASRLAVRNVANVQAHTLGNLPEGVSSSPWMPMPFVLPLSPEAQDGVDITVRPPMRPRTVA